MTFSLNLNALAYGSSLREDGTGNSDRACSLLTNVLKGVK